MIPSSPRLPLSAKVGYGLGDVASCLFWQTFAVYLANFYTDVFGLTAAAVATMLLVTRTWDLGYDLVMGVIADRTSTRWGKFRPYLLWVPVPLGIVTVLTFTTPDFSATGKLIYAYLTYGMLMMLYSSVNVPYAALLGVMTTHPQERNALSSYRMIGAFAGSMFVTYTNYGLTYYFSVPDSKLLDAVQLAATSVTSAFSSTANAAVATGSAVITAHGYQSTIIVYAVLAVFVFTATFLLTKETVQPISDRKNPWRQDVMDLLRNYPWLILVLVTVLKQSFAGVRGGMAIYYFKYYVHSEALSAAYLMFGALASIASIYLVQFIPVRFGKKMPYIVSIMLSGVFCVMSYWVGPTDYKAMFVYQILINFFMGPPTSMLWSLYGDTADYSELKTGRRATGLIFSASGMSQKLGWTIASSVGLYLLGYYSFQPNVEQAPETLHGINLLVSIIPACFCFAAGLVMMLYPLNVAKVQEIETQLNALRNKTAEDAAAARA